ncbi:lipoprotein LpqH [Mycolicibacterium sp.]|uniref:lipoprotein LpqH n=1 Tax=Mycolicibacterium sp. TaxID=2320850 RepID=UPI003D0BBAC3
MMTHWALTACAAAAALTLAGCSSEPPEYQPSSGSLSAGTAQVTVNGHDAGTNTTVQCSQAGSMTTINTGDDASGISAVVDSQEDLVVRQVGIRDLGGFTGSYNDGLGGEASATMTGRTFTISGTADGFDTDEPSFRSSGTFEIKVAC